MKQLREELVANLPWPWNPFKCQFADDFRKRVEGQELSDTSRAEQFELLMQGRSPDEIGTCRYHQTDWPLVASIAVELHRSVPNLNYRDIEDGILGAGGTQSEVEAAKSLWIFPIVWTPGAETVGNGQHRICALKTAQVELVLVEA
jgi:hypothetical protein